MSGRHLLFCPYLFLPNFLDRPIEFANWELAPLRLFEGRWSSPRFKKQAIAFLRKFVEPHDDRPIEPILLCRKGKQLDGQKPSDEEVRALELSLAFAAIDCNPRRGFLENSDKKQAMRTTENAVLHLWSIGDGNVIINTGYLVPNCIIDATAKPVRPPLDLHMPNLAPSPDHLVLTGIYETVLKSLQPQNEDSLVNRVRVAVEWFTKAWLNTRTVHDPVRLVFLKTAFEALTGTSTTCKSASHLRQLFEALSPPPTEESAADYLMWSPSERPIRRTWVDKKGKSQEGRMTDLEVWFREFGDARNTIIHKGEMPELMYPVRPVYHPATGKPVYHGRFFFTAEFMLRGAIKALLASKLGYKNVWRSELWRTLLAEDEERDHQS